MPYNTNPIQPRGVGEPSGTTNLPLSRVKKTIAADPEVSACSNNAAFIITLATEMFIQHIVTEAHNIAKTERKPRRNIQYKDLANAVAYQDKLEFLEDIIPRTAPYKKIKEKAAATRVQLGGDKSQDGVVAGAVAGAAAPSPARRGRPPRVLLVNGTQISPLIDDDDNEDDAQIQQQQQQQQPSDDDVDMDD